MPSFEEIIAAQRQKAEAHEAWLREDATRRARQEQEVRDTRNSLHLEHKMVGIALGRSSDALQQADIGVPREAYEKGRAFYYRPDSDPHERHAELSRGPHAPVWEAGGYWLYGDEGSNYFPLYVDSLGRLRSTGSNTFGWSPDPNSIPRVVPIIDSTDFEPLLYSSKESMDRVRSRLASLVVKFDLKL